MASITLNGDTSGSIVVQAPAIAGSGTLTLPTGTGTILAGGPAFAAYETNAQTLSSGTYTKMNLTTERFDTNSCFSSSRFTPNVAGYYQISGRISWTPVSSTYIFSNIFVNGNLLYRGVQVPGNSQYGGSVVSALVYLNGSTDYVELYGHGQAGFTTEGGGDNVYLTGYLARAA